MHILYWHQHIKVHLSEYVITLDISHNYLEINSSVSFCCSILIFTIYWNAIFSSVGNMVMWKYVAHVFCLIGFFFPNM